MTETIDTDTVKEESKEEDDRLEHVLQERMVGKGIGNALQLFREKGMLGKTIALGRNKEKTMDEHLKSLGNKTGQDDDRVKLKYFDKRGKELKGKEAFRQMCWKFHGKMPSHKRQEKRRN